MRHWKNTLLTITITLNCMLLFFLVFESRLAVPGWLQVAGRLHTVLLHFPIVCVAAYALIAIIAQKPTREILPSLLLVTALVAVATCIMGLLLSREEGYDTSALQWHKWGGASLSLLLLAGYYLYSWLEQKKWVHILSVLILFGLVVFTGHEGGNITHGEDFLLAPLQNKQQTEPQIAFEDANVYTHIIQPILTQKCVSCHSRLKTKGDLVLETAELFKKGGKSGILWDTASSDLGLLLRRIHLPINDKKHMPPTGKPQLTTEEMELLELWIQNGADCNLMAAKIPNGNPLRTKAEAILPSSPNEVYDFDPASEATIKKLNTENRVVAIKAVNSPALDAMFFNSHLFKNEQLAELSAVKKQLTSLNLAYMPVTDKDLPTISQFENLRYLNLGFTKITGKGLEQLKKLAHLQTLNLSGIPIVPENLQAIAGLPKLKHVQVWETGIAPNALAILQKKFSKTKFYSGYTGDTATLKLSAPIFDNEIDFFTESLPVQLKHYIRGVSIYYTLDGTEPDSLHSPVYNGKLTITAAAQIKAKAYKKGWHSSDVVTQNFLKSSYTPDSIYFLSQVDPQYNNPPKTLIDKQKGSTNVRDGKWLGWKNFPMSVVMQFNNPISIQSIGLNSMVDTRAYIMPPKSLEVWGGMAPDKLKLVGKLVPQQPIKDEPQQPILYNIKIAERTYRYIRVVGNPVNRLPAWHSGKGDKGWVFADEIVIN